MGGDLSARELRALMDVVAEGWRDSPNKAMPWAAMDGLQGLVPCDSLIFKELDIRSEAVPVYQSVDNGDRLLEFGGNGGADDEFWKLRRDFLPCNYPYRTGDFASVIMWSDFYTAAQLRNAPMFADLYGREGSRHCMLITLPATPGMSRRNCYAMPDQTSGSGIGWYCSFSDRIFMRSISTPNDESTVFRSSVNVNSSRPHGYFLT